MNFLANSFAKFAGLFSGAESSFCIVWHIGDIECPKELIK